jgi:chorismate dehydratase
VGGVNGQRRPRVGHIQFLNCLPLYWGLVQSNALLDVELRKDTPDRLNDALVAGDLDVGPISLVEYLRHADELVLLPDLAVGSDGPVLSCNLVSQLPPPALGTARVALGSTSRTTVLLAQLWLAGVHGVRPTYFSCPPDLGAMMQEAAAAVLIGDAALRATFDAPARGLIVQDLGAAWRDWTGLPMVFAVWACPEPVTDGLVELEDALVASVRRARAEPERLAYEAAERYGYPAGFLARYFEKLRYRFGPRERAGLYTFLELARDAGLLETVPELRFVQAKEAPVA